VFITQPIINYPPQKKITWKILWKKNKSKQRVFRLLLEEEKKINGARKEIFLNEKKKTVMHDVEL
jgi:hypothetical protein